MLPVPSPTNSWSINNHGHYGGSISNGIHEEDLAISLLQTLMEMSLIRDELVVDILQIQETVKIQLDALNLEVDNIRAGQINLLNTVGDLRNHFDSLQACYVKLLVKKRAVKKHN